MGAIYSSLNTAAKSVRSIIGILQQLSADFNSAATRAAEAPGLPRSDPTHSNWLDDPPFPELADIRSDELPDAAEVVIIGSGITGAAVARSLLHERWRRCRHQQPATETTIADDGSPSHAHRIVVPEARQICSGATARNGGHIKPVSYSLFPRLCKTMSHERAAALTRFQNRHLEVLTSLCAAEGIDAAEARKVKTADLFLDEELFRKTVMEMEQTKSWIPEVDVQVLEAAEAREKLGVNSSVVGAMSYEAGAIWPYRFVTSIWKRLLDQFPGLLSIETSTPVTSISISPSDGEDEGYYHVTTSRGAIRARHVVHATNAFAANLLPGLRRKITGVRAHMSAQRPGDKFPNSQGQRSWGVVYPGGFDYVTQRPSSGGDAAGDLMLGGGFSRSGKQGLDQIGLYDDAAALDGMTIAHIAGVFPAIFGPHNWGEGGGVKDTWSGILGFTGDLLPFVGRLDAQMTGRRSPEPVRKSKRQETMVGPEPGEWIAAGFCGEGMVWAWLSGIALGIMLAGAEEDVTAEAPGRPGGKLSDWFPKELLASRDRLQSADIANLSNQQL